MTPLHIVGQFLRELLMQVPQGAVRAVFVALPLLMLLWVLRLPREATVPRQPTGRWGENLKWGAALALSIQVVIYLWL